MKIINYSPQATCPSCGGMLMFDASITDRLPHGLGFAHTGKFVIDLIERKGWRGQCMQCFAQVFAIVSQRALRRSPHSVNAKIAKAKVPNELERIRPSAAKKVIS